MKKYKVLEIYKGENLRFDFSNEYIKQEELDKEFITIDYIVQNTDIKNKGALVKKLRKGIITGLMCGYIPHKMIYIYKKDFDDVLKVFSENSLDYDTGISQLKELGFIDVTPNIYKRLKNQGILINHPILEKQIFLDKRKFEKLKAKLIEMNDQYKSIWWIDNTIRQKCSGIEIYRVGTGEKLNIFFRERKYNTIELGENLNFFNRKLYNKEGCIDFINEIISNRIRYIRGDKKYFFSIDKLSKEDISNSYYTYNEFKRFLNEIGEELPERDASFERYERYEINIIKIKVFNTSPEYFFRKEEVDKLMIKSRDFVNMNKIKMELNELTDKRVYRKLFTARNINVYEKPTTLFKDGLCIKKLDLVALREQLIYENQVENSNNIYNLYKIRLEKQKIQCKDIDIINEFDKYVLDRSNHSTARKISYRANIYISVCKILNENIDGNMLQLSYESKVQKITDLCEIASKNSNDCVDAMKAFMNACVISTTMSVNIIRERNEKEIDKYTDNDFTTLLIGILNILDKPNEFKKLLYERTASSVILYVLIHFVFAWRRQDLLEQLPKPNLKLIGYENGLNFLENLKNNQFVFEENHGEKICKDITEYVYRNKLKAYKNGKQLEASIPSNIYKYLGLLMCICEGNRQYVKEIKHKKYQNTESLIGPTGAMNDKINKVFALFGMDIESILGKPFGNLRGTKSFFSVLGERFEELKMCVLKAVSELRSHSNNGEKISTTGNKYYLTKDISKAAVEIFAKETMGSVKDYILKLTDNTYELLDDHIQLERFDALSMKNMEIETVHKHLYQMSMDLDKFFQRFNGNKELTQEFLRELLYGKSYSKHSESKCLLKAKINIDNNIVFEENSVNNRQTTCPIRTANCIGCIYLVASRLFIYEFKDLLNDFFAQFNNLNDINSKKLFAKVFKIKYSPLLSAFKSELGDDIFKKILEAKQYEMFRKEIRRIELIEG